MRSMTKRTAHRALPSQPVDDSGERRQLVRHDVLLDLSRWLEAARRRYGMQAMALADASGCLVAGAGLAPQCLDLAAHAPLGGVPGCPRPLAIGRGLGFLCASSAVVPVGQWTEIHGGCERILGLRSLS
jgi:hypothetical protein